MKQTKQVGSKSTVINTTVERVNGSIVTETSKTKTTSDEMIHDGNKWVAQKEVINN